MSEDANGSDDLSDANTAADGGGPTDAEVVETAAEAAEEVVFENYRQSEVVDLDVTVTFEDGVLEVDVYLNVPDDADPDPEAVVDEAARAAQDAVDELFAD
ncbi:Uncharacterized protein AArcCO_1929 [Halalkaliarchaeum sp. AArc-CO]|uniref:DUF3194 domain-containing protein n=1 Tax=unclassified Halalkaliarchaeum TaxID=2678344 RepID=UPI00217E47DA|nr:MULTISPECIES: DUF3194 domain-containing protein [unclassified Halalkaliarchaeum]MDR5671731.1 DUF3194 domain-containing protein [Halalkaliarchaeum sp. AArc-GB]UWG51226.1 Uncharacterized protein AArcCO_1929 [Halalkaliarchaeum sp. AArc-CO]